MPPQFGGLLFLIFSFMRKMLWRKIISNADRQRINPITSFPLWDWNCTLLGWGMSGSLMNQQRLAHAEQTRLYKAIIVAISSDVTDISRDLLKINFGVSAFLERNNSVGAAHQAVTPALQGFGLRWKTDQVKRWINNDYQKVLIVCWRESPTTNDW